MSTKNESPQYLDQSRIYEIRLRGQLSQRWASRLGEVIITLEDDATTVLSCTVTDQAALHGLLKRVRDLGMTLLSVNLVGLDLPGPEEGL